MNSRQLHALAPLGTSCPDHFLRTKIRPLIVPHDADDAALDALIDGYRNDYAAYYERCKHAASPAMRDPNAVIYLVPRVGLLSFAKDKATARIAAEFYVNAINVMRGASAVSTYQGLPEQEASDIEYWLLEEAKLQRMPKPKALAGRVALVTGGAGGIGSATAERRHMPLTTYFRTRYGFRPGDFPVADRVFARAFTLPLYEGLPVDDVKKVVSEISRVGG